MNQSPTSGIVYNIVTGELSLVRNITYRLSGTFTTSTAYGPAFNWMYAANNQPLLGTNIHQTEVVCNAVYPYSSPSVPATCEIIFTPTANVIVKLALSSDMGSGSAGAGPNIYDPTARLIVQQV